ncbi:lipid asymmetry maintenance protein MlaB [Candidatus Profftia sp. (ex Adelges kitamiensis)]|uniref:lipid asymmetry maintenance protein MlaB n=1 Tax=Candidatus Profftia sp. (ex Adelges kitamiensis) TaxID=2864218 RepID=UPI001CE2599A|nr:lipid asymmetry maintenance protein MlaB [Candidatus Profftia sp. (ex Adelges kitamiensis)]
MSLPYALIWSSEEKTLKLIGILDRNSLMIFWNNRYTMLHGKQTLDLSGLVRVDSAGLAMLVYLQNTRIPQIFITGASERLLTLIAVYNLHDLLQIDSTPLIY